MVETGEHQDTREKWLIAAWPGMGNVGVGACAYLLSKLNATMTYELPSGDFFDLSHISVEDGLATPGRLPRSMFFEWSHPENHRDFLVFLGEAQPEQKGYELCRGVLDYAASKGVTRIITFAAMATQLHPSDEPNVFGIATNGDGIRQLKSLEVALLKEGEITGLNGVLLAAAHERGLPGLCLMGELPYFAAAVPNPKASKAVLDVFGTMTNITIDFSELNEQAEAVEKGLIQLLEKLQETSGQDEGEEGFDIPAAAEPSEVELDEPVDEKPSEPDPEPVLDEESRARIESLFAAAKQDRSKAVQLKQELDRLGVFKQYEDRFLDLFKRGE